MPGAPISPPAPSSLPPASASAGPSASTSSASASALPAPPAASPRRSSMSVVCDCGRQSFDVSVPASRPLNPPAFPKEAAPPTCTLPPGECSLANEASPPPSAASTAPTSQQPPSPRSSPSPPPTPPLLDLEELALPPPRRPPLPLSRRGADRLTGKDVALPLSTICDACPSCPDTCLVPDCAACSLKRSRLSLLPPPAGPRCYTPCEIRRHNSMASCYLVAAPHVYDATTFIREHPGGKRSILRYGGGAKDVGEDINFHSAAARAVWKKLVVGKVKECGRGGGGEEEGCVVS